MADKKFELKIITPEGIFMETEATMVEMTTNQGDIGILPGHIALTAILVPSVARIKNDSDIKYAVLNSGFVEILPNKVTILTETAEDPDNIDAKRAEEAKGRAEQRLVAGKTSHDIDYVRAEVALKRAIARLSATKMIK